MITQYIGFYCFPVHYASPCISSEATCSTEIALISLETVSHEVFGSVGRNMAFCAGLKVFRLCGILLLRFFEKHFRLMDKSIWAEALFSSLNISEICFRTSHHKIIITAQNQLIFYLANTSVTRVLLHRKMVSVCIVPKSTPKPFKLVHRSSLLFTYFLLYE